MKTILKKSILAAAVHCLVAVPLQAQPNIANMALIWGKQNASRGYDFRKAGPRDSFSESIGRDIYRSYNVSYTISPIQRLRFAIGYDIGTTDRDPYSSFWLMNEEIGSFNENYGVGIRPNSSAAPLRLDYGTPIRRKDGNQQLF